MGREQIYRQTKIKWTHIHTKNMNTRENKHKTQKLTLIHVKLAPNKLKHDTNNEHIDTHKNGLN